MSFFKKMFGSKSFDELLAEADAKREAKAWGDAKLAYDRALEKSSGANAELVARAKAGVREACDRLAEERIAQAEEYVRAGELELATTELEHAHETAASDEMKKRVEARIEQLERDDAREKAMASVEVSEDEHYAALAGGWEEEQAEEYESYGESFRRGILALNSGDAKQARELFDALLREAKDPHYLLLEVGRARIADGDAEGGEKALRSFLASIGPDEGGNSRLHAHLELARIADERGDVDGAMEEFEAAIASHDEHPGTYLVYGRYLRGKGKPQEAVEVLDAAVPFMGEARPELGIWQELGLAYVDLSDDPRAIHYFEQVIEFHTRNKLLDFPPETTVALAKAYERQGRKERAADLYRSLTNGSDRANHGLYYREAARLLLDLDVQDEARRLLQRASELTGTDEAAKKAVETLVARLG